MGPLKSTLLHRRIKNSEMDFDDVEFNENFLSFRGHIIYRQYKKNVQIWQKDI